MSSSQNERPKEFDLPIQGGLLDNLGINMYANLGKCLVELAANAYDSESPFVDIELNVDGILAARGDVRANAIENAKKMGLQRP